MQSAVVDGAIIVRDQANQKQDVSTLSRDTDHANGSIGQIFNKEKEQKRLQTAQMIGDIGNQVADIARTNGKIAATEAANEKMKTAGGDARNAAISQLKKDGKEITDQAIHDQMYQTFYNEAFNKSGMGTGQSTQRAITAATAAVQALAGGDIKAAIAGASAPYIANAIANAIPDTDLKGRVLAHAVVNAALAAASGRDAASAATGAAVGELVGKIAVDKLAGKIAVDGFGKPVSELSEEEKQTVSALATLASGLAGGLVGDSSANAVAAAQAGKTTVENNSLSKLALEGCAIAAPCRTKVAEKVLEIGVKAGITGIVAKEIADKISADKLDHLITLKMMGNDDITSKYLGLLEGKYGPSNTGGEQIADSGPTDTGGNQTATGNTPSHTGKNKPSGQGSTNTGNTEGLPDTGGNTTVTPIPDGPNKDDLTYLALKGKEAQEAAKNLGFDRRIPPQKAPFNSHGQPVYSDGKNYITPDIDSHNVTNGWKMFDRKGNRIGTYDSKLNRIKD